MQTLLSGFDTFVPDMPLSGAGQLRTRTGNAVEDFVCQVLGIEHLKIDGREKICWDAKSKCGTSLEIKSLKPGGRSIIYKWRAEKEEQWAVNGGHSPFYLFVVHSTTRCVQLSQIYESLARTASVYVMPAKWVHEELKTLTLRFVKALDKPNPRDGARREGYRDGYYSLPFTRFAALTKLQTHKPRDVYGLPVNLPVYWREEDHETVSRIVNHT